MISCAGCGALVPDSNDLLQIIREIGKGLYL